MTNRSVRDILNDLLSYTALSAWSDFDKINVSNLVTDALDANRLAAAPADPWHRKGAGWTPEALPEAGKAILMVNGKGEYLAGSGPETHRYLRDAERWTYAPDEVGDPPADTGDAGGKDGAA